MQSTKPTHKFNAIPYVKVEPNLSSVLGMGHYVEWELHPKFKASGDFIFYVEKAPSPTGPWELVAQAVNQRYAFDNTQDVGYKATLDFYYQVRLKLVNKDRPDTWYLSDSISAMGYWWNKRDYLISKEIIRKELLVMNRGSGNKGYLLKRKSFGRPCPVCLDPATGEVTDSKCEVCFGTGFEGGYYDPIEFWVQFGAEKTMRKLSENGMISETFSEARVVAFPEVEQNDVWINASSGQVYRFGTDIANIANIRNVPIIKSVQLSLVNSGDILYTYSNPKELETLAITHGFRTTSFG